MSDTKKKDLEYLIKWCQDGDAKVQTEFDQMGQKFESMMLDERQKSENKHLNDGQWYLKKKAELRCPWAILELDLSTLNECIIACCDKTGENQEEQRLKNLKSISKVVRISIQHCIYDSGECRSIKAAARNGYPQIVHFLLKKCNLDHNSYDDVIEELQAKQTKQHDETTAKVLAELLWQFS